MATDNGIKPTIPPTPPAAPPSYPNRDKVRQRIRERHPDRDFPDDDDEAFYGQINDDYDEDQRRLDDYKSHESQLSDMFAADPRSASFLISWSKGGDPVVELVKQFGTDIAEALDDPDRQEDIAKANKEYLDRVTRSRELEDQYQANLQQSLTDLGNFQSQHSLTDDDIDRLMQFLITIVSDGVMGKFTPESMQMALNAVNHDTDVQQADREGEVRGKNTRITEQLRHAAKGDGTPALDGMNNKPQQPAGPDLGALDRLASRKSVWDQ